jgi:hypothetical protein
MCVNRRQWRKQEELNLGLLLALCTKGGSCPWVLVPMFHLQNYLINLDQFYYWRTTLVIEQIYLVCIGLSSITRNLHGNHIEQYHHHHHHHHPEEAGVEVTL